MINNLNFIDLLDLLGFKHLDDNQGVFTRSFNTFNCDIKVDFNNRIIIYPEEKGLKINDRTTCNFDHPENFVVLECICRLLLKGYRPEHIELEKRWNLGHDSKGGKADIYVYDY